MPNCLYTVSLWFRSEGLFVIVTTATDADAAE